MDPYKSGAYKENIEEAVLGGIGVAAYNFGKRALGSVKDGSVFIHIVKR